jgi:ABC-type antimicrobial peptide transport system permease subunit
MWQLLAILADFDPDTMTPPAPPPAYHGLAALAGLACIACAGLIPLYAVVRLYLALVSYLGRGGRDLDSRDD